MKNKSIEIASVTSKDNISIPSPTQPSFVITKDAWDIAKLSIGDINTIENAPHIINLKHHERLRLVAKAVTQQINTNINGRIIATVI